MSRLLGFFNLLFRINRRLESDDTKLSDEERKRRALALAKDELEKSGMMSPSIKKVFDNDS